MEPARAIALSISASPTGVLSGIGSTRIPAYIFNLYSQFAGLPLDSALAGLKVREPYDAMLELWRSDDLDSLQGALLAACEYHVARSREHNNKEYFEFCTENFRLQPVEILAVLRMRELLGLVVPQIDHPIMNTPAGALYPTTRVEPDPIIEPALKAALMHYEARRKNSEK